MKLLTAVLVAAAFLAGNLSVGSAGVSTPQHYTVSAGETYRSIAASLGLSATALACANATASTCPSVTATLAAGRVIHLSPVVATTTTTVPPTTTSTTTTVPATTTTVAPPAFPDASNTGTTGTLTMWAGAYRTSLATVPTEVLGGITYKVFANYLFDTGTSGQYLYVDDPNVIFRNDRFVTSGQVSNTSAMVQLAANNLHARFEDDEFDGGPFHARGIQGDSGDITVLRSEFTRFGNAGVEKDDRTGTFSLDVEDSYFHEPKGWVCADHVDGIQIGGGASVTIRHNTVLVEPYDGANGDLTCVSNSALGLWAELGNVTGPVAIDRNLLAGGGVVMYLQQKAPYTWQGQVNVTNNVVSRQFSVYGGIWGVLAPLGLPASLSWSGNTWDDGLPLSLTDATVTH